MKRVLILTFSVVLFAGCGAVAGTKTSEKATTEKTINAGADKPPAILETRPPQVGELVIARWAGNSWYEGRIQRREGERATVAWIDDLTPSEVDLIDIYAIPRAGAQSAFKAGDYVLTKRSSGTDWVGAQVTLASPGVVTVKYNSDFGEANLPPEKVIAVSPSVAADMKIEAARTDFITKAQALRPQAPADYRPKAGERVLGAWTTNAWYAGRVKSVNGNKATVVWEGPRPDEAAFENLVPYPTAENGTVPGVGDYVLVKPSSGSWDYAQVAGVNGSSIEVKDAYGKSRSVKQGEFVILR
ncbi:MAG TPA: hypothetical protein VF717_17695 [Pyrinomonadaceae bacterium]